MATVNKHIIDFFQYIHDMKITSQIFYSTNILKRYNMQVLYLKHGKIAATHQQSLLPPLLPLLAELIWLQNDWAIWANWANYLTAAGSRDSGDMQTLFVWSLNLAGGQFLHTALLTITIAVGVTIFSVLKNTATKVLTMQHKFNPWP